MAKMVGGQGLSLTADGCVLRAASWARKYIIITDKQVSLATAAAHLPFLPLARSLASQTTYYACSPAIYLPSY
jgi:hypothetical protein